MTPTTAGWTAATSAAALAAATPAKPDELTFYCPWSRPWVVMLAEGWRPGGKWRDGDLGPGHGRYAILLVREVRP
jgi:hypothetical protein